jgi:predicted transposase YdaD
LPIISDEERKPLVFQLLLRIEQVMQENRCCAKTIQQLRNENAKLKG